MSKFSLTEIVLMAFFTVWCLKPSLEARMCKNAYNDPNCQRQHKICCNGVCNATCIGKRCRWDIQCSSRKDGHKCCNGICRASCEGHPCQSNQNCKGKSLKCCSKVCRKDSCLGYSCNKYRPSYRTCRRHFGQRMSCCSGRCELSCLDKPCVQNEDCGGWGRRKMSCCDGVCKKSCLGSRCDRQYDCNSNRLDCCGVFGSKTCQKSCLGQQCSLDEVNECGRRRSGRLFCCGDGTCRRTCLGSICFSETYRDDCKSTGKLLYCCGMGQKRCRLSCSSLPCKKNEDCGTLMYYCGSRDQRNISACRITQVSDLKIFHDVNLQNLYLDD
ncbi:keratin-associated protein 4-7-like [Xenia sp. Carnegie-2017]|uniref:keratin-associated protein 4-7-like n=1 Tax=Xenia sp. Carnegie-2017 TaxID=2897299 RepID=UPI001F04E45D|nr:keratin-associated protein 4-7-like [Xenia sp. Carnegie-2017]